MARAIRAVTVERGLDPRDLTLLAFGGSGPVHACDVARSLDITRVLFPPAPGVFTAAGMLAGAVEHHERRYARGSLDQLSASCVDVLRENMRAAATARLRSLGYDDATLLFSDTIDLRLEGQDAALSIPFHAFDASALRAAFITAYCETYGYSPTDAVEVVALRLRAQAGAPGRVRELVHPVRCDARRHTSRALRPGRRCRNAHPARRDGFSRR